MPYNTNYIPQGSITPNHPVTGNPVTHSFGERQLTAEFDDALLDQQAWKNPRYDGSKLTAAKINKFTSGDIGFQNQATLLRQTTALYISDSVINFFISFKGKGINSYCTIYCSVYSNQ